jgi:tRNA nucleotidyltransferase (CCA-adding enzyme)
MEEETTFKRPKPFTTYGTAKNGATMKIVLTENESRICDLLQKVSDYIAAERPDLPQIESRIAGGWVRDKVTCHM